MTVNYSYNLDENVNLSITTYDNFPELSKDCIIYVHGFKGFKDWGFVPYLGNYFAQKRFFVITFNFSHNGIGDDPLQFTEIEKFAENTFSRELNELNAVISAYRNGIFSNFTEGKIGVLGHSRGGGIAILTAASNNEVNSITTWSSVSGFDRYSERQKLDWKNKGVFEVLNTRTKQLMKMNVTLLEDIENNITDSLNIEKAVRNLKKKYLIIHGEEDLAVRVKEGEEIYDWADKQLTEFVRIPKTGHTFKTVHPFDKTNDKFEYVLQTTTNFFEESFR